MFHLNFMRKYNFIVTSVAHELFNAKSLRDCDLFFSLYLHTILQLVFNVLIYDIFPIHLYLQKLFT